MTAPKKRRQNHTCNGRCGKVCGCTHYEGDECLCEAPWYPVPPDAQPEAGEEIVLPSERDFAAWWMKWRKTHLEAADVQCARAAFYEGYEHAVATIRRKP